MFKALYYTNMTISAVLHKDRLPASLLSLALEGKVRLFVSEELLGEYEGVLKRPKSKLGEKEIENLVKLIRSKAIKVKPTKKLTRIKKDLVDNRVLECALEAQVDFIVTETKNISLLKNSVEPKWSALRNLSLTLWQKNRKLMKIRSVSPRIL